MCSSSARRSIPTNNLHVSICASRSRVTLPFVASCALVACVAFSGRSLAEVYEVGPQRGTKTLQDVAPRLRPGDVVLLDGDAVYPGGVVLDRPGTAQAPIVIRGVPKHGKKPVIAGGTNTVEVVGDHQVLENIELTGGRFRCLFHHADDVVVRRSVVRDCPKHGVLSADEDSGSLLLDRCEVHHCGSGLTYHQIYVASDESAHPGSVFRMQHCYVHDGRGGNNVKSRAERNEIYFNWIQGAAYHELELIGPDGQDPTLRREDSDVVGNVLWSTADAHVIRVGGDGTGETRGRYRFVNNTIVLRSERASVFWLFEGVESVEMHNNVLFRLGGGGVRVTRADEVQWAAKRAVIAGAHNWIPDGSTKVPTTWTDTRTGKSPGFANGDSFDVRPSSDSPLRGGAVLPTSSPEGFCFPSPLQRVGFEPPSPGRQTLDSWVRQEDGSLDIGALEGGFEASTGSAPAGPDVLPAAAAKPELGQVSPGRHGAAVGMCGCGVPGRGGERGGRGFMAMWLTLLVAGARRVKSRAR